MPTPRTEYRYPCESCGASLRFTPGQTVLTCEYCGHTQNISPGAARAPGRQETGGSAGEAVLLPEPRTGRALQWDAAHKSPELTEIPLEKGLRLDQASGDFVEDVQTLSCPNCGAKIDIESRVQATLCPFCATPVVTDTGVTRQIKPQGILPFVLDEAKARKALEDWLGSLWFAPNGVLQYARRGRAMSGVYSPFWTFDAATVSDYSGQRGDYYYETRYVTREVNGRMQQVAEQVRRVRWRPVSGRVARDFNDVLVLAATSLPRGYTDGLAPWDLSQLRSYNPEYIAGFLAEGYTVALADGHTIARDQMEGVITGDVRRDIGGDEQMISGIQTQYSAETFKHILLPIWTAAYKYNGKSYRFVVNGQTGRVQGERPWSVWKIAFAVLLVLAAIAAFMYFQQAGSGSYGSDVGYSSPSSSSGYRYPDDSGGGSSGGDYVIRGY
ncbi:zinc ribbon domain-containing protein [Paracoccus pacificus]|uniref:Zinc ribbon domain-containing protein n=1 Tax=Paracoccus pacificus TaxID=1463598 RepID=A0ABW4R9J2_9RHOB